jgi:hypothetical protein
MAFYFKSPKVGVVNDENMILAEIPYFAGKRINLLEVKSPL